VDPLFPELPEDLSSLSDEELANLLQEHEIAAELIDQEDEDFIKDMEAEEVLAQYEKGVEQIERILAEQKARVDAHTAYQERKSVLSERRKVQLAVAEESEGDGDEGDGDGDDGDEGDGSEEGDGEESAELTAEETAEEEVEEEEEAEVEVPVSVTASAEKEPETKKPNKVKKTALRRQPPRPSKERQLPDNTSGVLVAAGGLQDVRAGKPLDRLSLARVMKTTAVRRGPPVKQQGGVEEKIRIAMANFTFPEERVLDASDWGANAERIAQVVPNNIPGVYGSDALVASGGLCAPLTPLYTMPNFASQARPVRDSLPSFQADRGGVNVPTATIIGDITSAITVIEESDDALGGTFATKSCQDLTCPAYTETAVTIISHCREYGNLNARAWPEKIAHENDLTMAAHARSAEGYLLDRIKALSISVTQAEILGAFADLVHALTKAQAAIRFRLRMTQDARFRVLLPQYLPDLLAADFAMTQFDRVQAQAQAAALLDRYGISVTWYLDDIGSDTSQGFANEVGGTALDDFPDDIQWAMFPEGEFIHVDGGSLELGIVRDSTLNSTNDYQLFGETFENVARLGPAQGALWVVQGICPSGEFPALGTALSC